VVEPVLGAVPTDGLLGPMGWAGLAVPMEELLVPRFVRSILSSPTAPLVPGIAVGLLAVLLPVPAAPGEAVAPDPEVADPDAPDPDMPDPDMPDPDAPDPDIPDPEVVPLMP